MPKKVPPILPSEVPASTRRAQLAQLEEKLGIHFTNPALLDQALAHSSFVHESNHGKGSSYERLEFLGDSVINLVVSDLLFQYHPDASEGFLAKARARMVSEPTLARIARAMDLGGYILLGRGEEQGGGRHRSSILADVLEAVAGAIYLDAGYEPTFRVLSTWFRPLLQEFGERVPSNAKNRLQELVQGRGGSLPRYRVVGEEGPAHNKTFIAVVEVAGEVLGEGRGRSKKEATEAAASAALERLLITSPGSQLGREET